MSPSLVLGIIGGYFLLLLLISHFTSSQQITNKTFFTANRSSPWYVVAFGMIGASLSGVTFISVPGEVGNTDFSYFQIVIGYLLGYFVIAKVLLPLYYKQNLISIYGYLGERLGIKSYKTGAWFFLLSRVIGTAFRLFLVATVLQIAIFDAWNIPFEVSVLITLVLIYLYSYKGGIKTIVYTDTLQTFFMLAAVIVAIFFIIREFPNTDSLTTLLNKSTQTQIFFWDVKSPLFFWKQFFAGAFIAIVMTGLDQDMMQKNLTCRNLQESQKNMLWFSISLLFVNMLFLILGALLYLYTSEMSIDLPERTDELFPMLAIEHFPIAVGVVFMLGIVAAAYSSADSALTALTTSFCVDILQMKDHESQSAVRIRKWVHIGTAAVVFLVIVAFRQINDASVISSVFTAAGYTYGPILGMFAFGLFTSFRVWDEGVPYIAILSPILTYLLGAFAPPYLGGYQFGFELIIFNGLFTFIGLMLIRRKNN
ncbi:MAG: sodium:solute symporter [Cyclobacteriaceae bacterium]|nr:sodium:solute symporter [Cyclobacteriaceae bacterium]MCH8515788.1 sodium:solute symporter [Cyclobacteriaceae bacterium]